MSLEKTEAGLLAYLGERKDEILQFARELIRTPSPNPPGDERAVADLVTARLAALGITEVERLGASPERPNLVVRIDGTGDGPTLMLSGHLDTKPAGDLDAWKTDPWDPVLRDGDLVGLGSGDMKAAVAAMVYALGAIRASGSFAGKLVAVFTADEEAGSALGSKWLADSGLLEADVAVIGEPSGIEREWESLHLVSRGAALFKVKISGTQMHSSISDRIKGINATVKMARLIDRMDRDLGAYLTYEPHPLSPTGPTINVGVMAEAGVFYGVYPGNAEFACDLRTLPGMEEKQLIDDINRFLMAAMAEDPDLAAELVWELMVPATEISADEPIVGILQETAGEVLGRTPKLDAFPGATAAGATDSRMTWLTNLYRRMSFSPFVASVLPLYDFARRFAADVEAARIGPEALVQLVAGNVGVPEERTVDRAGIPVHRPEQRLDDAGLRLAPVIDAVPVAVGELEALTLPLNARTRGRFNYIHESVLGEDDRSTGVLCRQGQEVVSKDTVVRLLQPLDAHHRVERRLRQGVVAADAHHVEIEVLPQVLRARVEPIACGRQVEHGVRQQTVVLGPHTLDQRSQLVAEIVHPEVPTRP